MLILLFSVRLVSDWGVPCSLDLLGAQPCFGMEPTRLGRETFPDRETYSFTVHLDAKVGTLIEMIRQAAEIDQNADIFLFHGEGVHEDADPDRHIEGDDSRIAFWTRNEMLQAMFLSLIHI